MLFWLLVRDIFRPDYLIDVLFGFFKWKITDINGVYPPPVLGIDGFKKKFATIHDCL
jgi:hypothetical protein